MALRGFDTVRIFFKDSEIKTKDGTVAKLGFPVQLEKPHKTAIKWASSNVNYIDVPNRFTNLEFIHLEYRGNGGRAYKVAIVINEIPYIFDFREFSLIHIMQNGEIKNGIIYGNFHFMNGDGQTTLYADNSIEYQEYLENGKLNPPKKPTVLPENIIKHTDLDDLVVGNTYFGDKNKKKRFTYLGGVKPIKFVKGYNDSYYTNTVGRSASAKVGLFLNTTSISSLNEEVLFNLLNNLPQIILNQEYDLLEDYLIIKSTVYEDVSIPNIFNDESKTRFISNKKTILNEIGENLITTYEKNLEYLFNLDLVEFLENPNNLTESEFIIDLIDWFTKNPTKMNVIYATNILKAINKKIPFYLSTYRRIGMESSSNFKNRILSHIINKLEAFAPNVTINRQQIKIIVKD